MRRFRLIGDTEKTVVIHAYSHLDAGARWISDPTFYSIGQLIATEDLGYDEKQKVKSAKVIPFRAKKNKETNSSCGAIAHATTIGKRTTIKRERANARVSFGF